MKIVTLSNHAQDCANGVGDTDSIPVAHQSAAGGSLEDIWIAGAEGERRVQELLAKELDDDWILCSGYRNKKGEVDIVLVGPEGLIAIEVKSMNGLIDCHGNRWLRDKYDKYGNRVEVREALKDAGGRSPSEQINDIVSHAEWFLGKESGRIVRIKRCIVLAHPKSEIGDVRNLSVNMFTTLRCLNRETLLHGVFPTSMAPTDVVELLRQDHALREAELQLAN